MKFFLNLKGKSKDGYKMSFIKTLKEISKGDVNIAGGKGAHLGELIKINIPVPPGFVILSSAFETFLEKDTIVEIEEKMKKADINDIKSLDSDSENIRNLILKNKVSEELEKEILDAFGKLNVKYVAVRSSATAEDSRIASWAGELETYLNTNKETLIENVKKCWASLFTTRALIYRIKKGLLDKKISVAVVIQKMVNSEIAGVCFTSHPVTKKDQIIIEACSGLGDALVSGRVTPDSYVVEKYSLKILDIKVNPPNEKQKLSERQIREIANLCINIEDHYKEPQDIEWAFEKDKFYIVQTRPITV